MTAFGTVAPRPDTTVDGRTACRGAGQRPPPGKRPDVLHFYGRSCFPGIDGMGLLTKAEGENRGNVHAFQLRRWHDGITSAAQDAHPMLCSPPALMSRIGTPSTLGVTPLLGAQAMGHCPAQDLKGIAGLHGYILPKQSSFSSDDLERHMSQSPVIC